MLARFDKLSQINMKFRSGGEGGLERFNVRVGNLVALQVQICQLLFM